MRDTVILSMSDARARRRLIDLFGELGWRVRMARWERDDLERACSDAAARLIVVEAGAAAAAGAGGSGEAADATTRAGRAPVEPVSCACAATRAPVVAAGAGATADEVVAAIRAGACDYLVLDVDEARLRASLERVLERHLPCDDARPASPIEERLVGTSRAARLMRSRLHGLASLAGPVLVVGEAGTGRDTVARALHEAGAQADGPFRRIDCPRWQPGDALPGSGTLYLDHVDRLSPPAQQFFAHRVREMGRAGWERGPRVVASAGPGFVAARAAAASGDAPEFDAGLFEELIRFPLELVPLRERLEDVPEIADRVVARLAARMRREVRLTPDAHAFLARQGWPGNVQQLARLLERGVAFCASGRIDGAAMEQLVDDFEESLASIRRKREVTERDELLATLARTGGNISRCAEEMGRSRGAIYRLIEKYGIALPKTMRKRGAASRRRDEMKAAG